MNFVRRLVMALMSAIASAGAEDLSPIVAGLQSEDAQVRGEARQQLHTWTARVSAPDRADERTQLEQALTARLRDASLPPPVRTALIVPLETIGGSNSVPALAALLGERDPELRDAARRALEINPSREAGTALLAALDAASEPRWRIGLIHSLGMRRETAALPALSRALEDPVLREVAAAALVRIGGVPALTTLQRSAATGTPVVATAIAETGRRAGGAGRAAWLRLANDTHSPGVARAAASAGLIELEADPEEAVRRIVAAVCDPATQVRTAAIAAAEPRRSPALSAALTSVWDRLATDAKLGALTLMDSTAAEFVAVQCASADPLVACHAVEMLARLQGEAAAPKLIEVAASDAPARAWAARALEALAGESVAAVLRQAATQGEPARRAVALTALARRRDPQAGSLLLTALQESNPMVSRATVEGLKLVGTIEHLDVLVRAGLGGKADALEAARAILVRTDERVTAVGRLIELAKSCPPASLAPLVDLIGAAGGADALGWIRSQLTNEVATVRDAAVRALANWPDAEVLVPLRQLVTASDAPDPHRRLAIRGIARLVAAATNAPAELRYEAASAALSATRDRADRVALISALAGVPDPRAAAALREQLQAFPDARDEILVAMAGLAEVLQSRDRTLARELAKQVMETPSAPTAAKSKAEALAK